MQLYQYIVILIKTDNKGVTELTLLSFEPALFCPHLVNLLFECYILSERQGNSLSFTWTRNFCRLRYTILSKLLKV